MVDTSYRMSWEALQAFLAEHGFTVLECNEFQADGGTHHQLIAAHLESKLLLHADSYGLFDEEVVNSCSLYCVIRRRPDVSFSDFAHGVRTAGTIRSRGPHPADIKQLILSYTRPLAGRLAEFQGVGEFVNWNFDPALVTTPYLSNHSRVVLSSEGVAAVFQAFLDRCPREVLEFITAAP